MGRKKTIADADLLATAREVFVEKGFGASTNEIARRAGVSQGVLFQRYGTKRELFFAAMVLPPANLARLFHARERGGFRHLEDVALELVDYFRATVPVLVPLMTDGAFRFEEFARKHPDSPLDALRRDLVAYLVAEKRARRIGPIDPGAAALMLIGMAQTVAFFEHMGAHGGRFPDEFLRRAVRSLWNGLAPPGDRGRL